MSASAALAAVEARLDDLSSKGLAQAVTRAIRDGALEPGQLLPPIRSVAQQLMLSPTTVSSAWQLLARSGTIRSDGRRGTTVTRTDRVGGARYLTALRHGSEVTLDLSTGTPDGELLPDLGETLRGLSLRSTPTSYLDDPVIAPLRRRLATDWPYAADDLLVVDGAQDGLDLVIRTLLRPGDLAVVDTPAFPPLLDLLENWGVEVVGVELDETGPVLSQVETALARRPAAVFLQPRSHNPTGVSMSPTRAQRLARLIAASDACVVEDDSAGPIAAAAPISLGQWVPEQVLHLRSFSKSFGPDLRIAAMSGPPQLLSPLRHARALGQGWTSRLLQHLLVALLESPSAQKQVDQARAEYARRRELVVTRLAARGVEVGGTDGINIWVPVRDESAAVLRLASHGIAVTPGSPFSVDRRALADAHVRVTTGLVRRDHEQVADLIADAADIGAWTAAHR